MAVTENIFSHVKKWGGNQHLLQKQLQGTTRVEEEATAHLLPAGFACQAVLWPYLHSQASVAFASKSEHVGLFVAMDD
jgi:hypothetical protein